MKKLLLASAMFLVAASAEAEPQRISISFSGSGYNGVANQFLPKATFATIHPQKKGDDILWVEIDDPYWNDTISSYQPRTISFRKSETAGYVAAIDKYLAWTEIATRDGDMITKEITRVSTRNGKLRFQMHSGNASSHYLVIDFCSVGVCLADGAAYFSVENAIGLKETLEKFGSGELAIDPDIDSKYQ